MPKDTKIKSILVIGSGPIIIGQAAEFDYAGTQACIALKEEGYRVILVNNNPATVMTDHVFADAVYFEPMTTEGVEKVIQREKPDGILGTLGGQAGLNLVFKLSEEGILEKYNVKVLGTSVASIKQGEDREAFRSLMHDLNEPVPESEIVQIVEEAVAFAEKIGFPLIVRPAYTLGGTGGGIAETMEELISLVSGGLSESPIKQCLVERSIAGFKEIEYEMMRDAAGTCIAICNMENIDPVGIHTGDSIVVAPSQTLTDREYQMLRTSAVKIISALGIVGGCNIQFALDPKSKNYYLIEVNPRVSRSSALASKATGYPIARMAAKLAVGCNLAEIINPVTGTTFASYEPSLDYVVVKIPKWPFEQFPHIDRTLGTQMKATGEAMAIDRSFERAFIKAVRSLNIKTLDLRLPEFEEYTVEQLYTLVEKQTDQRVFALLELLRRGEEIHSLHEKTKIDLFFLNKFKSLTDIEKDIEGLEIENITASELRYLKEKGFSDSYLAKEWKVSEKAVRELRKKKGITPVYKMVDTCAAEFESASNYFYSSYLGENEATVKSNKRKVLVIGSGPISIGQGIEFDYCSVHGVFALKEENVETIMINNNPETVSTDFTISDRLYFEPLTLEDILNVIDMEGIEEVIVQLGGQTALNLAKGLEEAGVKLLGTSSATIDMFEDRDQFYQLLDKLQIPRVKGETAEDERELLSAVRRLGYPVLIRPSYVIGGLNMVVLRNAQELNNVLVAGSISYPILVDQYLEATEAELDLASDGEHILIPAIIEHIEKTGVHSGDSFCIIPAQSFSDKTKRLMAEYAKRIVHELKYKGLMNIQFIVKENEMYLLEVNPRSSRTMPIVSKVAGVDLVKKATKILLGKYILSKDEVLLNSDARYTCVKHPVFSNFALKGLDSKTGPQMISTGEGISIAPTLEEALNKSFHSISGKALQGAIAFADKNELLEAGKKPANLNLIHIEKVTDHQKVTALYCPGTSERDISLREWAVKNRKIVLTQKETLNALLKSTTVGNWDVSSLDQWLTETSEEVMAE
ncbi:carbamoyl phosphate synthase large subunit [Mesobacillus selenatarsenatis]|uniref:Carbamoyl-phosphate synthase large chain n=1 Tax=Mesobacillus selenatarsenatis (strain DSM 18680 / JCM 14380 / FERM P-15431 / SF-1) TaxID=1321606 RepID=A0A0A8X8T1_MESS1|nr:carbamoyl phosphate synthase large subunit [Mesobacillus selenatarsenatis]GAM15704.1 carbamoyl-phosphate synthase large chain [Mesobacillus selenatarsenatis SF-1]